MVAQVVMEDQTNPPALQELCARAGVTVRTIERAFKRDTGMSFESWRRQVRLTKAIELLMAGHAVKEVAFRVGYKQPSAFVEMFRRTLGTPPKAWALAVGRSSQERL